MLVNVDSIELNIIFKVLNFLYIFVMLDHKTTSGYFDR